jgi:hypothetical protein
MLGVAADMVEAKGAIDKADADKIGAMVATSISQKLVNKTYLSGLSNLVAAIHDPSSSASRMFATSRPPPSRPWSRGWRGRKTRSSGTPARCWTR